MKWLCVSFFSLVIPAFVLGDTPGLKEARQRWLHGNYEEARELYQAAAKEPSQHDAAVIGVSRTWESQGEYDKALEVVDVALQGHAKSADLLGRRAEVLYLRGRWEEAAKSAASAIELKKDHLPARWVQAQIYRDRGEIKKADLEFRWFVHHYNDADVKDPDSLLLIGLAGCENARWNNIADQFEFILNEVYADALKREKDFWPAEYESGALLLEKYKSGDALDAFDKTLTINPKSTQALVGKGIAALQKFEIKDAERLAERALKVNPRFPDALQLRSDVHLAGSEVNEAMKELETARQVNPRSESTLGRIAACFFLKRQTDELKKLIQEVEQHNSKPGLFYFVLANQLDERRRYDDAEKFYKKAMELWPQLPWAENSLGLLYMRMGREKEAQTILAKAFEADPFNVRVSNALKVLHHLEKYASMKTDHFELRYDPAHDKFLVRYLAKYLEDIYGELTKKFNYQPKDKILIEVFNNHDMFSGRVVSLPDLHTIGACTGRMIAMVSPRGKGIAKPFNWSRVLRHELVHIFNLEQTNFQVPHWYTEGLAVMNEGFPRPQQWNELLLERVPAGKIMNLDDINLGFIRPRSPLDWHMAYCQSQLYVQFMQEKFGPQTTGELLAAFADGLETGVAINKVCKVDKAAFERDYRAYLDKVVQSIHGKPTAKPLTLTELQDAHDKDPNNADVAAQLAEQYFLRRRTSEARKLAETVLAQNKSHPLATYVKARLLMAAGDEDQARLLLESVVDSKSPETKVLQALGKLYYEAKDFPKAAKMFEIAHKAEPLDSKWLVELARVYNQSGDRDNQINVLRQLVPTDADDLDDRRRLAQLLVEAEHYPEAERYAREALEIDVLDMAAQQALGDALLGQGQPKLDEAIAVYTTALEMDDKQDAARIRLAQAYLTKGEKQKAENEIARVLARDPDNAEAKKIQAQIDKK
jgi:tetratricopeptide (TPR) repeat protein